MTKGGVCVASQLYQSAVPLLCGPSSLWLAYYGLALSVLLSVRPVRSLSPEQKLIETSNFEDIFTLASVNSQLHFRAERSKLVVTRAH